MFFIRSFTSPFILSCCASKVETSTQAVSNLKYWQVEVITPPCPLVAHALDPFQENDHDLLSAALTFLTMPQQFRSRIISKKATSSGFG